MLSNRLRSGAYTVAMVVVAKVSLFLSRSLSLLLSLSLSLFGSLSLSISLSLWFTLSIYCALSLSLSHTHSHTFSLSHRWHPSRIEIDICYSLNGKKEINRGVPMDQKIAEFGEKPDSSYLPYHHPTPTPTHLCLQLRRRLNSTTPPPRRRLDSITPPRRPFADNK